MGTVVRTTGLMALAALVAATVDADVAMAEPHGAPQADQGQPADDTVRWQENLGAAGATANGVREQDGVLSLTANRPEWTLTPGEGYYTFPPRQLARPMNRVDATISARTPAGSAAEVEVRAVTPARGWTEWQPVSPGHPVVAPFTTTQVQVRVVLTPGSADSPTVSGVALTAGTAPATAPTSRAARAAAPTYRVPATREGLVGRTTANGHVIRPNDHFVALPSRRALNANDQTRDYKVRVCNPRNGKCVEEPVFDVGPWNTKDDYWNPSNVREMWRNLPQGKPEATAAYYQDYNNGRDQFGRQVANPSGIDLADGTWASLGMTGNDVVDVTYLWKAA